MPAMFDARHHLALGRAVAGQLVRDHHSRGSALPLQQLAQQALGGLLVPPALDQDVENDASLVDGASQPMLHAGNGDDHLIEMPLVPGTG